MEIGVQGNSLSASSESLARQFDTGQILEKSLLSELLVATDSIICNNTKTLSPSQTRLLNPCYLKQNLPILQNLTSSTPVSQPIINQMPLNPRKRCFNPKPLEKDGIPKTLLLTPTLDPVSTSKEKTSFKWWTKCSRDLSAKLWLPIKTDCVDSDTTSSNICVSRVVRPSPCCITELIPKSPSSVTTFSPSLPIFPPFTMAKKDTAKQKNPKTKKPRQMDKVLDHPRSLKVRLYPPKNVKEKWNQWIGCARATYNSALYLWKNTKSNSQPIDKQKIKTKVTTKENILLDKRPWLLDTPYSIRGNAVNQLWKNINSAFAAKKKKIKSSDRYFFNVKYMKKTKFNKESVVIETTKMDFQVSYSHVKIFSDLIPMRDSTAVKDFLFKLIKRKGTVSKTQEIKGLRYNKDCRLMLDRRTHRWYLIVTYDKNELKLPRELKKEGLFNEYKKKQWVAIDPGVRVKSTFYSPEGVAGEIDSNFKEDIKNLATRYTECQNKWVESREKNKKSKYTKRYRHTMGVVHSKIEGLRRVHHYTAINYLMDNYQNVLLPEFKVSDMVKRKKEDKGSKRKIRKVTVKEMMLYSHYQFKNRLINRGGLDERVFICLENHTTKTCGMCFKQNEKVGSEKIFKCVNEDCGLVADRDIHAARNIFLKHTIPCPA